MNDNINHLCGCACALACISLFVCTIHSCGRSRQDESVERISQQVRELSERVGAMQQPQTPGAGVEELAGQIRQLSEQVKALQQVPGPDMENLQRQVVSLAGQVSACQKETEGAWKEQANRTSQLETQLGKLPDSVIQAIASQQHKRAQESLQRADAALKSEKVEDAITYTLAAIRVEPEAIGHYDYLVKVAKQCKSEDDLQKLLQIMSAAKVHVSPKDVDRLKTLTFELQTYMDSLVQAEPARPVLKAPNLNLPAECDYGKSIKTLQAWLETAPEADASGTVAVVERHLNFLLLLQGICDDLNEARKRIDCLPKNARASELHTANAYSVALHLKSADMAVDHAMQTRIADMDENSEAARRIAGYAKKLEDTQKEWAHVCELCMIRTELDSLELSLSGVVGKMEELRKSEPADSKKHVPEATGDYTSLLEKDLATLSERVGDVTARATCDESRALCAALAARVRHMIVECNQRRTLLYQRWALARINDVHKSFVNCKKIVDTDPKHKGKKPADFLYDCLVDTLVWVDPACLTPLTAEAYNMVLQEMLGGLEEGKVLDCKLKMGEKAAKEGKHMPITVF